jgi:hypothetical protein
MFNKKGVALIILIITITIVAVMGAGIVSFMGAKQKSYTLQVQSYQAYTLAHAGVEFAVRYAHDNWVDFNSNPYTYISGPITPVYCTTTNGKNIRDSSNNTLFYLCYDNTSDKLTSIGVSGATQRKVVLSNFRTYANH